MLSDSEIQTAAQRLHQAEKTRVQTRQLSLDYPGMAIEDAYGLAGEEIAFAVHVSDGSSLASPLRSAGGGRTGGGGSASPGLLVLAAVAVAVLGVTRARRWHERRRVTIGR